MVRIILILLGFYILYKFVFEFLLPVAGAAKQMKKQMETFNQQQQNMFNQKSTTPESVSKTTSDDYIDFEEVK
ncbi:MAG: hypothetical protein ACM3H8_06035 [Sphingobacteriales bacterium]